LARGGSPLHSSTEPEITDSSESWWQSRGALSKFATVVVAFLLVVRMALPFVLEQAVPKIAERQNLVATIGNIDLGLLVGEIALEDLIVDLPPTADASHAVGDAQPLLALDRIYIAFEWTDLLFGRLHLTDLVLQHPVIEVTQFADGTLELPVSANQSETDVVPKGVSATNPPTGRDWEFMLDRFELNDPDISLRSAATNEEVVRFAGERLGFDGLFVGPEGFELGGVDVAHPELFVQREWLLARFQSRAEPAGAEEAAPDDTDGSSSSPIASIRMSQLKIDRAGFTVQTAEGPVAVAIRLDVQDVGTDPGHTFPIDLGLEIDEARIAIDGSLGLNPVSFTGRLAWQKLSVPPLLLLAYPKILAWLISCDSNGDLQVVFRSVAPDGEPGLTASGSTMISALSFKHPETGELAVEWDSLTVDLREAFVPFAPFPESGMRIALSALTLESPTLVYTNPPDALDELLAALVEAEAAAVEFEERPRPKEKSSGMNAAARIEIDQLSIRDASLQYVDRSVKPIHRTKVEKLRVQVDGLSSMPTMTAQTISADGLIQSRGSFKLRGTLPRGQGKLDFSLSQLDLVSYDSLARSAGWQVESGATSLESTITADNGSFSAENALVLHDLDVAPLNGDSFASRFGMSIDVALALLRDPAGDISLSVPVSMGAEGVGVELGPIVRSALRDALKGAIASPMKMLGMLVPKGENADSLGTLPFTPGRDDLDPEVHEKLGVLIEFVENRPMLALSLRGHWSDVDREPTARRILMEKALSGDDFPVVEDSSFFARRRIAAALRARGRSEVGLLSPEDEALLARYVAAQPVSLERLHALAGERANRLERALLEMGAPATALSIGLVAAAEEPSVSLELDIRAPELGEVGQSEG
jgi:hypothetical protein